MAAPERAIPRSVDKPAADERDAADFERVWRDEPGLWGLLTAVQNGPIGMRFIATAFLFFLLGGIDALMMRAQLAVPEGRILTPVDYNQRMTMHGTLMMFLFAIPLLEGLGALVLPQMLGARELPYPRLSAFAFWTTLFGGAIFYLSVLLGQAPAGGWYAYTPLTGLAYSPDKGMDFWLLGLNVAEIGGIAGAIELIIAVLQLRGIGMTLDRIPIFAWAMLVTSVMILFAFTPLIVVSTLLELDRKLGMHFFNPDAGGQPLLWQHLFWFFGHPDVYIQFLPAVGLVSMILPVFVRRRLEGYTFVTLGILATGVLSFGLWVHHMFAAPLPRVMLALFSVASMLVAIPSGLQVFSWLATIWNGRPVWRTPFLFVIGFLVVFVLGGLTGVMLAAAPFDWQVTDTYFIVAHFHYVLIGGMVFPIFAALYYWWPKFMEHQLDERLGQVHFWLFFIGFNVTFFPMHLAGFLGMPRRVYTYPAGIGLELPNLISTVGAFILALGVLVFMANVAWSRWRNVAARDNPWEADSLEWATPTPMPQYGFRTLPIVRGRHPLWDQEDLAGGDDRIMRLVRALADWPRGWRAQLTTTTIDAQPLEVFRVVGPSIWPFVLSASVTLISVALIFDHVVGALIATAVSVVALVAWHWPDRVERAGDTRQADAFEREHGIPVNVEGSPVLARWAMLLTILTLAIALASLLFCYAFLRLDAPRWPPAGADTPDTLPALIGAILLLASAVPLPYANRAIRRGARGHLGVALAASFLLGGAGLAATLVALGRTGFSWDTHAYGSVFFTLAWFLVGVVAGGLALNGQAQLRAWAGHHATARYRQAIDNVALYGYFAAAAAVVVFATLYLPAPR